MSQLHEGHRGRLRQRFEREGLAGFEAHEVLEFLLYFTIPLRNVNPLAHQLIERFGSLAGVFSASREDLTGVPGVGLSTAEWLTELGPLLDAYSALRLCDRPFLDRLSRVTDFGQRLFGQALSEQLWVLNMNPMGHLLHSAKLAEGQGMIQRLNARLVLDTTLRYHAQTVVILQRRLPAHMEPGPEDIAFIARLNELLSAIDVQLMDNVMLCGHRRTSFHERGIIQFREKKGDQLEERGPGLAARWLE